MRNASKLPKLLLIAILLIGISVDACFAQMQPAPTRGPTILLLPDRHKCLDLIELERLKVNPQNNTIVSTDQRLVFDYVAISGWLEGYFTAWNHNPKTSGDVTKGVTIDQTMRWIFVYCRSHPLEDLEKAAIEFMSAMGSAKQ